MPLDGGSPVVALGLQRVVGRAEQAQVLHRVFAAAGPGHAAVVEMEASRRRAAPARLVDEAAAAAVAHVHRASHRGGDVPRRRRDGCGLGGGGRARALPGRLREPESPRLQPLELLADGLIDDVSQIAPCLQQLESLQLRAQLGARGELHEVPRGRERNDVPASTPCATRPAILNRTARGLARQCDAVAVFVRRATRLPGREAERDGLRQRGGRQCRRRQPPLRQLPDAAGRVRKGCERADQPLDLPPRPVRRALEQALPCRGLQAREHWRELRRPAQVQAPVGQHREQDRMPPRRAGHRDPQVRLVLGEVERPGAVREQRRERLPGVEPPLVHLGELRDQLGLDPPRLPDAPREPPQQLVVGERSSRLPLRSRIFQCDDLRDGSSPSPLPHKVHQLGPDRVGGWLLARDCVARPATTSEGLTGP